MALEKLVTASFTGKGVTGLADVPNLSASEMQAKFDELAKEVLAPKLNETIDAVNTLQNAQTAHGARTDNPHSVSKAQVGLGNADNTSDLQKPVSEAQAASINSAYVNATTLLAQHAENTGNPHAVTAAQVGAATEAFVWDAIATTSGSGSGTPSHPLLSGRDSANQHPISAITGLQSALGAAQQHAQSTANPHGVTDTQTGLCTEWSAPLSYGAWAKLCTLTPQNGSHGAALLHIDFTRNGVSVSDTFLISVSYSAGSIVKIASGAYTVENRYLLALRCTGTTSNDGVNVLVQDLAGSDPGTTTTVQCRMMKLSVGLAWTVFSSGTADTSGTELAKLENRNDCGLQSTQAPTLLRTGASGIWTYLQYTDGTTILWGTYSGTSAPIDMAWGGIYGSQNDHQDIPPQTYPFVFTEVPKVWAMPADGSGFYWLCGMGVAGTTAQTPPFQILRGSTSGAMTFSADLLVVGKGTV